MKKEILGLVFLEIIMPILFIIISITLLIKYPTIMQPLITHITAENSPVVTNVSTIATIFCAIIITSLSVFGSTVTHSIVILSEDKTLLKRFILYATGTLLGSASLFLLSMLPYLFVKVYIGLFVFTFSSIWAYTVACIYMFYMNIVNVVEEKQNDATLLGEVRRIKKELRKNNEYLKKIYEKE